MPTTGPNYPSSGASLANSGTSENSDAWTNPGNVGSSSAVASIVAPTFDSGDISEILVASNFGFSVTGTVLGITVEISKRGYTSTNSGVDYRVQLATGTAFSNLVGDNKASASVWPQTTLATTTYGGTSDTWNAGLTAAQVNATGFAVFLSAYANVNNADVEVDWIRVTITTSAATSASAGVATGTGASNNDTAKVEARGTGYGTSTGTALVATGQPGKLASATLATGTGTGLDATADTGAGVNDWVAGLAEGTGAVLAHRAAIGAWPGFAHGRSA